MSQIMRYPTYPAIQYLLGQLFAHMDWTLTMLGSGVRSAAWSAQAGDTHLVVRVTTHEAQQPSPYAKEYLLLELLRARGCLVQEPIATHMGHHHIPEIAFDWLITSHLDGTFIGKRSMTTDIAYQVGTLLAHLHHIGAQGYGTIQMDDYGIYGSATSAREGLMHHWQDYQLWGLHDNVQLESTIIGSRFPDYLPPLLAHQDEIAAALDFGEGVICHADLHNEHILLDADDGLAGIIDFGNACLMPPAWDFAIAARYFGWRAVDDMLISYTPNPDERHWLKQQAYLLGLVFGVFRLQRQFVRNASVIRRARTLQFLTHTLNRLNQR